MRVSSLALAILLLAVSSCTSDDEGTPVREASLPLNTFSMKIGNQEWVPGQREQDACSRTFSLDQSGLVRAQGEIPFYTIWAYKDPQGLADYRSEDVLLIQFMNVTNTGTYPLTGTYKQNFDSFVIYNQNKPGEPSRRYVNRSDKANFWVTVAAFHPISGSVALTGIQGTFSGTLYNEANPLDSLVISSGKYSFRKMHGSRFNQCEEK